MKESYAQVAGMIDHALLHPTLNDAELRAGCEMAARYRIASVCIKPYAVALAAELLRGSGVATGTVIGFPHGSNATEIKRAETAAACRDGAVEIDMVVNVGKATTGEWDYVERDIRAVCDEAHAHGALVKVIFETDFFIVDDVKIELCRASERAGADFVKTSTGFGYVKRADGFTTLGATAADIRLMRAACSPRVQVKASGGVRDLDTLLAMRALGASRIGTSSTTQILDEYRRRESAGISEERAASDTAASSADSGY